MKEMSEHWRRILDFHFKVGDKVKIVNKKLSCYGGKGIIYAVHTNQEGIYFYALQVTKKEIKRIYPKGKPIPEEDLPENSIWTFFFDEDLELVKKNAKEKENSL